MPITGGVEGPYAYNYMYNLKIYPELSGPTGIWIETERGGGGERTGNPPLDGNCTQFKDNYIDRNENMSLSVPEPEPPGAATIRAAP